MKANPALEGTITTPDGKIYGLPQVILAPVMRVPTKMWLNSKAMAAVGMETPTTTEELYDVLLAIRDSDWNGNGEADEIPLIGTSSNIRNYFLGSFGLRNRGAHAGLVDVDLMGTNALGYSGNYETWDYATTDFLYLGFNVQRGICQRPEVRRVLALAVDRDSIVQVDYARHAAAASLPVHPASSRKHSSRSSPMAYCATARKK